MVTDAIEHSEIWSLLPFSFWPLYPCTLVISSSDNVVKPSNAAGWVNAEPPGMDNARKCPTNTRRGMDTAGVD